MYVCSNNSPPFKSSGRTLLIPSAIRSWSTTDKAGFCARINGSATCWAGTFHAIVGRTVTNLLPRNGVTYDICPFCEGVAGEGDDPDPWLRGYFLASNSTFSDSAGNPLGIVHVLKDITDRKRAEEKYRTLVSNVQEGVFISTPQGRFLDFNDALLRMTGYDSREELLNVDIAGSLYVNPWNAIG